MEATHTETSEQNLSIELPITHTVDTQYEIITELDTEIPNEITPILSHIPNDTSEIVVLDQSTNLAPELPTELHATPICQPHNIPLTEEIIASETEQNTAFHLQSTQYSKVVLNENASIEVSTTEIIGYTDELRPSPIGPKVQIMPDVNTIESLVTNAVMTHENVSDLETKSEKTVNAKISRTLFEAPLVSEDFTSDKEGILSQSKTKSKQAKSYIIPMEAIQVFRPDQNEKEIDLPRTELASNNAICDIASQESVEISQVFAEFMPDKYYPEIVVATEVASSNVVEHKSYQTLEFHASEKEDDYTLDRKPIEQTAITEIIKSEHIKIEETEFTEDTQVLDAEEKPQLEVASDSYTTYEGLQKHLTEYLESSMVSADKIILDTKEANVAVIEQISNVTEVVYATEQEQEFQPAKLSTINNAETAFALQESCNQLQPIVHEFESELLDSAKPTLSTVTSQLILHQQLQTENVETLDTIDRLANMKLPQSGEATIEWEPKIHSEGIDVMTIEKEEDFAGNILPKTMILHITSDVRNAIAVESTNSIETEEPLATTKYDEKLPSVASAHALKAGISEEVNISMSVSKFENAKIKQVQAQQSTDLLNETVISTITTNENVTDGLEIIKPKLFTAEPMVDTKNSLEIRVPDIQNQEDSLTEYVRVETPASISKALSLDDHTHRSVNVAMNEIIDSTEILNLERPLESFISQVTRAEQNESVTSENTVLESIIEIPDCKIRSAEVQAKSTIDEDISLNVTEIKTIENDAPFDDHFSAVLHTATVSLSDNLCHLQTDERNELTETSILDQQHNQTFTAKRTQSNLQETTIEEVITFEELKPVEIIEQDTTKGKISIESHKHVTITEQNFQEDINKLRAVAPHTQHIQNYDISHALVAPSVTETQYAYQNGAVNIGKPLEFVAQSVKEEREALQGSENIPLELISEINPEEIRRESRANLRFGELSSLISSEQDVLESENTLQEPSDLHKVASYSQSHYLKSAEIEETQPFVSERNIILPSVDEAHAKINQESLEELTNTENVAYETLQTGSHKLKPNSGVARQVVDEMEHLTTLISNIEEYNVTLDTIKQELVQNVTAVPSHQLKSPVISEILTNDSLKILPEQTIAEQFTKSIAEQLNQADVSEGVLCTDNLIELRRPKQLLEGVKEGIILNETKTFDSENILDEWKTELVEAKQNIDEEHKFNEQNVPEIYENVSDLIVDTQLGKGKVVVIPNNSLSVQQPIENEIVSQSSLSISPKSCRVDVLYGSLLSVIETTAEIMESVNQIDEKENQTYHAEQRVGLEHEAISVLDEYPTNEETISFAPQLAKNKTANVIQEDNIKRNIEIRDINLVDSVKEIAESNYVAKCANTGIEKAFGISEKSEVISMDHLEQFIPDNLKLHTAKQITDKINTEKLITETLAMETTTTLNRQTNINVESKAKILIADDMNSNNVAKDSSTIILEHNKSSASLNLFNQIEIIQTEKGR